MSRIGQRPVEIPDGVNVTVSGNTVVVMGKVDSLTLTMPPNTSAIVSGRQVLVNRGNEERSSRCCHGLARTLIANMVEGVAKGYSKQLEIEGVGYKASVQGQRLEIALGFSHPVIYAVPAGIKCEVEAGTKIKVSGADKQMVGETAARIRAFAKAEPYKGKGVRYVGERIRRKVGKTVA